MPFHKGSVCYKFAVLVDDDCACWNFVFHHCALNFSGIFHRKPDFLCFQIAVRRKFLTERIGLPCHKPLDNMGLFCHGSPSVNHIAVLVDDCEHCAGKLCAACDILLCKFKGCRLIQELAAVLRFLLMLSLVLCLKSDYFLTGNIAFRRCQFLCLINCKWVILFESDSAVFIRDGGFKECSCLHNHFPTIAFNIFCRIQSEHCAGNRGIFLGVFLNDRHIQFLSVIGKCHALIDYRSFIVHIDECYKLLFPVQYISIRRFCLHYTVLSERKM